MNKSVLSLVLFCVFASLWAQEPPGCSVKSATTRTKSQLRTKSGSKTPLKGKLTTSKRTTTRSRTSDRDERAVPLIASPIYLPQSSSGANTAITASNGYLYVVVGNKLYKVNEKTMRTVEVTTLSSAHVSRTSEKEKLASTETKTAAKPTRRTSTTKRVATRTSKLKRG